MSDFSLPKQIQTCPEETQATADMSGSVTTEISVDGSFPVGGMGHAISKLVTEAVKQRFSKFFLLTNWVTSSHEKLPTLSNDIDSSTNGLLSVLTLVHNFACGSCPIRRVFNVTYPRDI